MLFVYVVSLPVDERGSLISREEIERGSVSLKVYFFYAKAIGLPMALVILLLYPLQAGIIAGSNYWLSEWSNAGLAQGNVSLHLSGPVVQHILPSISPLRINLKT